MKNIHILIVIILMIFSCKKEKVKFTINKSRVDIQRKDSIRNNMGDFFAKNKDKDIISAYFYLIEDEKFIQKKDDNLYIGFNTDSISIFNLEEIKISPIPTSYKINKKPANYNVVDSLGNKLETFVLDVLINPDNSIKDCNLRIYYLDKQDNLAYSKKYNINQSFDYSKEFILLE